MSESDFYRWCALGAMVSVMTISASFRRRARVVSGTIPRKREGPALAAARVVFALPLFLSVVAYLVNPRWMAWSSLEIPTALRALGVAVGALAVPCAWWVFSSIGENISETVLTKERHSLVTRGPYRWIRHPLYTLAITLFAALGLMAANWFILAAAAAALVAIQVVVIPREESQLLARFGNEYRLYQATTGRMIPTLRNHR